MTYEDTLVFMSRTACLLELIIGVKGACCMTCVCVVCVSVCVCVCACHLRIYSAALVGFFEKADSVLS